MDIDEQLVPLAPPNETGPECFPELWTLSPAFLYRFVPVPDVEPAPPEYVYLTPPDPGTRRHRRLKFDLTISQWNIMWEAGHIVPEATDARELPRELRWLVKVRDRNLRLVPRLPKHRYDAYAPLYHLLPVETLHRSGLPLLRRGLWPHTVHQHCVYNYLPRDFDARLGAAFSRHIWPLLDSRSGHCAFTNRDPVRLLSHHLDYWLPYVDLVAQRRIRALGRCDPPDDDPRYERDLERVNEANVGTGVQARRPWHGGSLWMGEDEAWQATQELVDVADSSGALRGIIEAVKANRIQDDFSSVWSYEREDFERKLYHKRSKIRVVFVEMPESVPIYSEDTEVHERILWGDFMTLLDPKERRVAVCLRRGEVGPVDIAKALGYANHSPVSKALSRIRRKASRFFSQN